MGSGKIINIPRYQDNGSYTIEFKSGFYDGLNHGTMNNQMIKVGRTTQLNENIFSWQEEVE